MAAGETPTQELVVMYLSRAAEHLESIQRQLDAGDEITQAERLDALTTMANGLAACLTIVAQKVDEVSAQAKP
jgi:HPt (histidine-containing phosphotransfer) domain-containing protein